MPVEWDSRHLVALVELARVLNDLTSSSGAEGAAAFALPPVTAATCLAQLLVFFKPGGVLLRDVSLSPYCVIDKRQYYRWEARRRGHSMRGALPHQQLRSTSRCRTTVLCPFKPSRICSRQHARMECLILRMCLLRSLHMPHTFCVLCLPPLPPGCGLLRLCTLTPRTSSPTSRQCCPTA